jgi:dTDP-4-dehydrorhamnose 3,5-epimerase
MSAPETKDFILETELPGVFIIERPVFGDDRGFFRESFRQSDLETKLDAKVNFVQANHSRSVQDTLRGIHVAPWAKLVTCIRGNVQQIVVDSRPDSPAFGKYISVEMGEENWRSVYIPPLCGNAFLVLSEVADYTYLTGDYWAVGKETEIRYNDPDVNVQWQTDQAIVSERDQTSALLREQYPDKFTSKQ